MKELSIEEKARRYELALERCRKLYKEAKANEHTSDIEDYETIFPELKGEDENIRKWLLDFVQGLPDEGLDFHFYGINKEQVVAWLEKQGKESITIDDDPVASYNNVMISDKIEPKFHKGDWVVNRNGGLWEIKEVLKNTYDIESLYGSSLQPIKTVEQNFHLWTIQDAKYGDVLVHNGWTFIFMGIKNGVVQALEENLFEGANPVSFGKPDKDNDYYPATKEQRDTLFVKIKEAGYEWNTDTKELKKISK